MNNILGHNIEFLIGEKSMSKNQLANKVGVHHSMITEYIKGTSQPSIKVFVKICEAFRCDPNTLLKTKVNDNVLSLLMKVESLPPNKKKMVSAILNEFISYHHLQTNLQGMIDTNHVNTRGN